MIAGNVFDRELDGRSALAQRQQQEEAERFLPVDAALAVVHLLEESRHLRVQFSSNQSSACRRRTMGDVAPA